MGKRKFVINCVKGKYYGDTGEDPDKAKPEDIKACYREIMKRWGFTESDIGGPIDDGDLMRPWEEYK